MLPDDVSACIRSIAANVRRLREQKGLSQEQLAEVATVDPTSVQLVERGTGNPTARVLICIAGALGVEPGSLFAPAEVVPRPVGRPRKSKITR